MARKYVGNLRGLLHGGSSILLLMLVCAETTGEEKHCTNILKKTAEKIDSHPTLSAKEFEQILAAHQWKTFHFWELIENTLTVGKKENILFKLAGPAPQYILGTISLREVSSDYRVIELKDADGNISLIDPISQFATQNFTFYHTRGKVKIREWKNLTGKFTYFDMRRQERISLVQTLLKKPDPFGSKEFYNFVESSNVEKMIRNWYGLRNQAFPLIHGIETSLGEKYLSILADPGVACRMEDFIPFAKEYLKENADVDSFGLRMAYAKDLQRRKGKPAYRGMVLTRKEHALILRKGIRAIPNLKNLNQMATELADFLNEEKEKGWQGLINSRTSGHTEDEQLISITDYEPVARHVGYGYSANRYRALRELGSSAGNYLYVFKLNIPELSIIRQTGAFTIENRKRNRSISIPAQNFSASLSDPGVEGFVFGLIPKSSLVSDEEYDEAPKSNVPRKEE